MKRKYETVGIDLGTTYSAIAYIDEHGDPKVVHNPSDHRPVVPSAIFFDGEDIIVGENALEQACVHPDSVAQYVKRSLGEPVKFVMGKEKKEYTPETLSGLILKKLMSVAEPAIGEIKKVVVTVPAFFNEKRRSATEHAGQIAGLEVVATLNEPSAALIAYGLHTADEEKHYIVYDLGGGTFDVTVMRVGKGKMQELATGGNRKLGGYDWDEALVNYVADEFVKECGADPRDDAISYQSLMTDCRRAKRRLSELQRTTIRCSHAGKLYQVEMSRSKFERLTKRLVSKTELTIESSLQDAGLSWDEIDGVVLVGGSTRMPMIQKMVQKLSGKDPLTGVDPEMAVALGAAIYAAAREQESSSPQADKSAGASAAAPSDEQVPLDSAASQAETTSDDGDFDDLAVVDLRLVNSHGIGVFARNRDERINVVMIPKNSELPVSMTKLFRTVKDDMNEIGITITEGDTEHRGGCDVLGRCTLGPLPSRLPKGSPIELQLGFDRDGRVTVSAICKATNTTVEHEIQANGILSEEEVEHERQEFESVEVH